MLATRDQGDKINETGIAAITMRWIWAEPWQQRERETTAAFDGDHRRFTREHAVTFKTVVRETFAPACDAYAKNPTTPWPAALRVKPVRSAPGILEMTWSFASPDGRATFELVTVEGELRCRWRPVGDHGVLPQP
jgi:hypothetical protein